MRTTKIADRNIPIEPGELIIVRFSGGAGGTNEAGAYEFWTVINNENSCTARCLQGNDPGERFRRMEGKRGYEICWKIASTAKAIRPGTQKAVTGWLNKHPDDACFAESCLVGGASFKVVKTVDGYQFK
ncbi:MAG TPA: hypothetical protein VJL54_02280 [Nitrososphaera sp.]|nr:hypothetical protein [Nitrososphaera sp.]